MYGQNQYGTLLLGQEPGEDTSPDGYTRDLMSYLPRYYAENGAMGDIQRVIGIEIGALWRGKDDTLAQYFVSTATWGLDLWEAMLGLQTDQSKSFERRREIVLAKLRGVGTTTKQMIIDAAAAFSGGEVDVIEYPEESRFVVRFVGMMGIPVNMAAFIDFLEAIRPAHLAYSFEYTYVVWQDLAALTWSSVGAKTWNELKVYEGV